MKTTKCPLGGCCGGTGWVWVMASPSGEPEPSHYVRCECNPHAAGEPDMPLDYGRDQDGNWVGKRHIRVHETVSMDVDDAPF